MKLTHVFGLVVAVHAAVFTVIFATPGCRSTGKGKPRPEDTDPAVASSSVTPVDSVSPTPVSSMTYGDVNAGAPAASHGAEPVVPAAAAASYASDASGPGVRFAPTRPVTPVASPLAEPAAPAATAATAATHTVGKGDSLWSIAKKYGVTVSELAAANKLATSATLRLGQTLTVPAKAAAAPAAGADAANTYTVKSGDTLGSIARKQGTNTASLRAANNLSGDSLRVGQKLVIPGNATPLSASSPAAGAPVPATAAPHAGAGTYTVAPGDTLGSIAQRHGVKSGDLGVLNNITDPKKLRVGQVLKLPANAKAAASATSKPVAPKPAASRSAAPAAPAPVEATPPPAAVEQPVSVAPAEPAAPVEPMAVPVIRIDN